MSTHISLVPIPAGNLGWRERGFDHITTLAKATSIHLRSSGISSDVVSLLGMRRQPKDSVGLTAYQRARNISGTFVHRTRPLAGPVVLLDDVLTTGATLAEAHHTLAAAGISTIFAATLAST